MAAVADKIQIRLNIGRNFIPLTVPREAEEVYRTAARAIEEKLSRYRTRFPDQGEERYLSIVLIDFAVRALQAENAADTKPYNDLISELSAELERLQAE